MSMGGSFLAGAKSRLLPVSIPFRFFGAAAIFHIALWAALFLAADKLVSFRGGAGPTLAAVHLLTLGVLVLTAVGASAQLLPVATRRPLALVWPLRVVFWLTVPGLCLLLHGMEAVHVPLLIAGAVTATLGLIVFAGLMADNLRRSSNLGATAAYGWAAVASLVALVALGVTLSFDYFTVVLPDHAAAALAHMILGGFGFMGLLALGFSHVLIPMFTLAHAPAAKPSFVNFAVSAAAVAIGVGAALAGSRAGLAVAAVAGLAAAVMHIALMRRVLLTGMRKRLGPSFVLVRISWGLLLAALLVGLADLFGVAGPNGAPLFGVLLLGGWLLTFLMAILQRILPFLASMHAPQGSGHAAATMQTSAALKVHAAGHLAGLAAILLAIVFDAPLLARAGSAAGLVGAIAFAYFTATTLFKILPPTSWVRLRLRLA